MKQHRDEIVARLRDMGKDEEADRALQELPERVSLKRFEGKLRSYGLGATPYDPPGGAVGWGAAAAGGGGAPGGVG